MQYEQVFIQMTRRDMKYVCECLMEVRQERADLKTPATSNTMPHFLTASVKARIKLRFCCSYINSVNVCSYVTLLCWFTVFCVRFIFSCAVLVSCSFATCVSISIFLSVNVLHRWFYQSKNDVKVVHYIVHVSLLLTMSGVASNDDDFVKHYQHVYT